VLSHTVPERLLKQFAFEHEPTKSLRLWKYEKGLPPNGKASPSRMTAHENFFADPQNRDLESEIETALAQKIEEPVNAFLQNLCSPPLNLSDSQRRHMTRYITLLFSRSRARREGSKHIQDLLSKALSSFLHNDIQLRTVAAHWSMQLFFEGKRGLVTIPQVVEAAKKLLTYSRTNEATQSSFVSQVQGAMTYFDDGLFQGEWRLIRASPEEPFILSDSPVTTWVRDENGTVQLGSGIARPDVELLLPLSPLTCLHIVPKGTRTRPTQTPNVEEVNRAQAAFAYRACFANHKSSAIDDLVQKHISTARIGKDVFTLWHMNYDNLFYAILLNQARDPL
jgi:hypothetical protein